jgi:hypothetical protein
MCWPVGNARALHDELFEACPEVEVKRVSRLEREAKELANRSLVYGEIPFDTVEQIFQLVRDRETLQLVYASRISLARVLRCERSMAYCLTAAATSTTLARAAAKSYVVPWAYLLSVSLP